MDRTLSPVYITRRWGEADQEPRPRSQGLTMLNHDLTDVSTFRAMLARDFADTPRPAVAPTTLFAAWIDTRLGPMVTLTDKRRLHLLEFASRPDLDRQLKLHQRTLNARFAFAATAPATAIARQLAAYFTGQSMAFDCVLAEVGTTFQLHVWANLQRVPPGETRTYTDLAREAGQPKAVRAASVTDKPALSEGTRTV